LKVSIKREQCQTYLSIAEREKRLLKMKVKKRTNKKEDIMKVLMFGWEFPPHISGGLGTACYGLTKGLTEFNDVEVTFVVPKA
jgi:hypothetical protein